jgi:uncharacterized membrane protein YbhN (UPF0104 family)
MRLLKVFSGGKVQGALRIIITVLFVVIVNRKLTADDAALILRHISLNFLLLVLLLGFAGFFMQVMRWHIILKYQGFPVGNRQALKTMLWGSLLAFITPGRLGELFRGLNLDASRKGDSIMAVVLDRSFAITITLLFAMAFFAVWKVFFHHSVSGIYGLMNAALVVVFFIVYILITKMRVPRIFGTTVTKYVSNLRILLPDLWSRSGYRIIGYSVLAHVFLILQTAVLFEMFGVHQFLSNCVVAAQAYAFMVFLPFFIANAGIREYSFALFLGDQYSVPAAGAGISTIALGVSCMILIINIVFPALCGLTWDLIDKMRPVGHDHRAGDQ